MTGTTLWEKLKGLVEVDRDEFRIEEELGHVSSIIDRDEKQIPLLEAELTAKKDAAKQAKKDLDELTLQSRELSARENTIRTRINDVTDERSYNALTKELESIMDRLEALERGLAQCQEALITSQDKLTAIAESIPEKIQQLQDGLATQRETKESLEARRKECGEKREGRAAIVPPEWLAKYNRMKSRVADPIVPISNTSCSACYYAVTQRDLALVKNEGVIPCRNCYRFLYVEDVPVEAVGEPAGQAS